MAKLSQYQIIGVVTVGDDNIELDSPIIQIVNTYLDLIAETVDAEIMHTVMQGEVEQKHSRNETVSSVNVYNGKKLDLSLVMEEVLLLPQYSGAVEI
jgi:hypothetical protein